MSTYDLVAVARTPQAAAPPTLTELERIVALDLAWTDELVGPGSITFTVDTASMAATVKSRLIALDTQPTEVWLYRDGTIVAAGILNSIRLQGGVVTATCPGLLAYAAYMHVVADIVHEGDDQFAIAAGLIDQWQALSYGDYGIDTSGVGTSGVTRSKTYLAAEQHNVLRRLLELGAVDDGFDVHVNPSTRALVLDHPGRGNDLTASIIIDNRNIDTDSIVTSVLPGDYASNVLGVGTGPDRAPLTSTAENATAREAWGRTGATSTFDPIAEQTDLDDRTQAFLDARDGMLLIPGPGIVPVVDVDVDSFGPGDTVTYSFDGGLGAVTVDRRVAARRVSVDRNGNESIAAVFA